MSNYKLIVKLIVSPQLSYYKMVKRLSDSYTIVGYESNNDSERVLKELQFLESELDTARTCIAELEAQLKSARKELHEAQIQRDTYKMDAEIAEDAIVELDKQVAALQAKQASDSCPVCFGTGQVGKVEQLPFDGSPEKQAPKFEVGAKVRYTLPSTEPREQLIGTVKSIATGGEGITWVWVTWGDSQDEFIYMPDELELDNSDEMA